MRFRINPLRNLYLIFFLASLILALAITLLASRFINPMRLEVLENRALGEGSFIIYHDFDKDGASERIRGFYAREGGYAMIVHDLNGGVIDQTNYSEEIDLRKLWFEDYNGDGFDEIFAFTQDGDSSYLYVHDLRKKDDLMERQFILERDPPDMASETQDLVKIAGLINLNGRDNKGLVFSYIATKALQPRSVYIFDMKKREIVREFPTHSFLNTTYLYDLTGNGQQEIIAAGRATGNIHYPAKYRDDKCWLFVLDQHLSPVFEPISFGEYPSYFHCPPIAISQQRFLLATYNYGGVKNVPDFMCLIDKNGKLYPRREFRVNNKLFREPLIDRETTPPAIYALEESSTLTRLDESLNVTHKRETPFKWLKLWYVEDFNADGKREILCGSNSHLLIYSGKLELLASLPVSSISGIQSFRKNGPGKPVEFVQTRSKQFAVYSLKKNIIHTFIPAIFPFAALMLFLVFAGFHKTASIIYIYLKYFRHSLMDSPQGILILNERGQVFYANQQFGRMLNLAKPISNKQHFREALGERRQVIEAVNNAMSTGQSVQQAISYRDADFRFQGEIHITPFISPLKVVRSYAVTLHDYTGPMISDRYKLWSKSVQKIAHDIKTPLSSVNINLSALQMRLENILAKNVAPDEREEIQDDLNTMRSELDRVHKMTRTFLKLSNLEKPHFQVVSVEDVVRTSLDKFKSIVNQSVQIELVLEADAKEIWADPNQIELVFHILIENALDALKGKGMIRIGASMAQYLDKDFDKHLEIEIADTGPGIDDESREKLFDPYFTTKPDGTGMGLAIAKKIIEDHGGNIGLYSREGFGTVIRFAVPVNGDN